jgi:hypothetical protein
MYDTVITPAIARVSLPKNKRISSVASVKSSTRRGTSKTTRPATGIPRRPLHIRIGEPCIAITRDYQLEAIQFVCPLVIVSHIIPSHHNVVIGCPVVNLSTCCWARIHIGKKWSNNYNSLDYSETQTQYMCSKDL